MFSNVFLIRVTWLLLFLGCGCKILGWGQAPHFKVRAGPSSFITFLIVFNYLGGSWSFSLLSLIRFVVLGSYEAVVCPIKPLMLLLLLGTFFFLNEMKSTLRKRLVLFNILHSFQLLCFRVLLCRANKTINFSTMANLDSKHENYVEDENRMTT